MKHVFVGFCIFTVVLSDQKRQLAETNSLIELESKGYRHVDRVKRGAMLIGFLLSAAKRKFFSRQIRIYERTGGLNQANVDFWSLEPVNVKQHKFFKTGQVDDRTVTLSGGLSKPKLTIKKTLHRLDGTKYSTFDAIEYKN